MAALQSKGALAARAAPVQSRRAVVAHGLTERAQIASASLAAAVLLASPAYAGVQLAQPALKKAFQDDTPARVATPSEPRALKPSAGFSFPSFGGGSAPATKAAPAPKKDEAPTSDGVDPRLIGLPASVAFVGGLAFLASKVDNGFDDFIGATLIKDSSVGVGVGYEPVIKGTYQTYGAPATGTKKVKATKKK